MNREHEGKAQEQNRKMSQLIGWCWADEDFKRKVLADPAAALQAHGVELPAGLSIRAVENTGKLFHLVILDKVAGGTFLDDTTEWRELCEYRQGWRIPTADKARCSTRWRLQCEHGQCAMPWKAEAGDKRSMKMGQLIAKCWTDEGFKQTLLADPAATLRAQGVELPAGLSIRVVENSDWVFHLVIPARPAELSKEDLDKIAGGTFFCACCLCAFLEHTVQLPESVRFDLTQAEAG